MQFEADHLEGSTSAFVVFVKVCVVTCIVPSIRSLRSTCITLSYTKETRTKVLCKAPLFAAFGSQGTLGLLHFQRPEHPNAFEKRPIRNFRSSSSCNATGYRASQLSH